MLLISHTFEHKFSNSFKQASDYFCENRLIKSNHSVKIIPLLDIHQGFKVAYFKLRVSLFTYKGVVLVKQRNFECKAQISMQNNLITSNNCTMYYAGTHRLQTFTIDIRTVTI